MLKTICEMCFYTGQPVKISIITQAEMLKKKEYLGPDLLTFAPLCLLCRLFSMMVRCSVAMNYGMAFSPPLLSGPVYPDIKGSNRGSIEAPLLSIWRTDAALIMTITQIL